jgi:hypothetical protein
VRITLAVDESNCPIEGATNFMGSTSRIEQWHRSRNQCNVYDFDAHKGKDFLILPDTRVVFSQAVNSLNRAHYQMIDDIYP